jgi:pyridoxal phosphate enzyme (YggS family)
VTHESLKALIAERLHQVEARISAACIRAGRSRSEVLMVAVTKSVPLEVAALLPELGIVDLAENRPQAFWERAAALPKARWHFIGHLQRNKIERTIPFVHLLHSVDSLRLLQSLETEAAKRNQTLNVLLEINASREANKQGFAPDDLAKLSPEVAKLKHVVIRGLMAMAAATDNPEETRPTFALARQCRDTLRSVLAPPHDLVNLSMGMSNDFEVAIEEGATLVRLGSVIFEGLPA